MRIWSGYVGGAHRPYSTTQRSSRDWMNGLNPLDWGRAACFVQKKQSWVEDGEGLDAGKAVFFCFCLKEGCEAMS